MDSHLKNYLSSLDEAFTWISKKVLAHDIMSVVSYNRAEIIHHIERRLTNPTKILDPLNLAPLTGREHSLVHDGKITLESGNNKKILVNDINGARFFSDTKEFRELWTIYLNEWYSNHARSEDLNSR